MQEIAPPCATTATTVIDASGAPLVDRRRSVRHLAKTEDARRSVDLSNGGTKRPVASAMVIDDHTLLGDAIVSTLRREGFHANAVVPRSLAGVVERVTDLAPTIALVDLDLGSTDFNGLDLIQSLQDLGVQVIALLSANEPVLMAASLEAGASAVVSKSDPFAVLLDAIKAAARGELAANAAEHDELRRLLRELRGSHAERLAPFRRLSPRERDVLSHLVSGRSAESIATASFVSLATVRSQIRAVLTKLEVHSQLGAVAAARTCGWTGSDEMPLARFSATLSL